jgi:chorismate mutase
MAEPPVISALVKKRAHLAGEIEAAQAKLHQMIFDLEHLDQTLSLFDPSYEIASIKPRGFRPPPDWARRGEMTRLIMDILRKAREPLTSRDVGMQIMVERAMDTNDKKLVRLISKRAGVALKTLRQKGGVRSEQMPGMYLVWTLTGAEKG